MNVTSVMTNRYEKKGHLVNGKNEPKTNPNEAKLFRNLAFVTFCKTEGYKGDLRFSPKNPEAKTNPNLLRIWSNISYGKLEDYKSDLDFSPKNPKAKQTQTNPNFSEIRQM